MKKEALLFIALLLASAFPILPVITGDTVTTIFTIGNVAPFILRSSMNVFVNIGDTAISLVENSTVSVVCNGTLNDANGFGDINKLNGTLYNTHRTNHQSADDNNEHYTNTSCFIFGGSGTTRGGECRFDVFYYADNSSAWQCNLTVIDAGVLGAGVNLSNSTYENFTVSDLVALNVPATMNFGSLNPGDTSSVNKTNVTNTGNVIIDITIYGFANNATGSPNAFNCTLGEDKNVSLYFLKYNVTDRIGGDCADLSWTANYRNLTNLTNAKNWTQFSLGPRTDDTAQQLSRNYTCWILKVPTAAESAIGGVCRGIVSFTAFVNEV